MKKLVAAIVFIIASLCAAQNPTPPSQAAGYTFAWQDTFSSLSLCTNNALICTWYNPGIPTFAADGVITNPTGYVNLNWASGQGNSFTNMSTSSQDWVHYRGWTPPVYIEVSMAFGANTGEWPAIWLRPVNYANSNGAEIDVFEWQSSVSSSPTTTNYAGTAHAWVNGTDHALSTSQLYPSAVWTNYNTYGVLWTSTQVCWYFNNTLVGSCVSTTSSPYSAQFAGQEALFLILSEQAGCNWTYSTTTACPSQVSPLNMKVQWVHVFTGGTQGTTAKGVQKGVLQ